MPFRRRSHQNINERTKLSKNQAQNGRSAVAHGKKTIALQKPKKSAESSESDESDVFDVFAQSEESDESQRSVDFDEPRESDVFGESDESVESDETHEPEEFDEPDEPIAPRQFWNFVCLHMIGFFVQTEIVVRRAHRFVGCL